MAATRRFETGHGGLGGPDSGRNFRLTKPGFGTGLHFADYSNNYIAKTTGY